MPRFTEADKVWLFIRDEAKEASREESSLASFYHAAILNHRSFEAAIGFHLANQLESPALPAMQIREVINEALSDDSQIVVKMRRDIQAYKERDPACEYFYMPFLFYKGYHALQAYRIAHWLWVNGRTSLALFFQNVISETFDVDIHPGADIGCGIMIDHATAVVVGETAVIGDNVSMLHSVTLGGSGCGAGARHPKIGSGVLLSAGAKILGNISIGEGARVGAGSLVLQSVPSHSTVVGVPAKLVSRPTPDQPALEMDHNVQS